MFHVCFIFFCKLELTTYLVLDRDMVMETLHYCPKLHCWKNVWKCTSRHKLSNPIRIKLDQFNNSVGNLSIFVESLLFGVAIHLRSQTVDTCH